MTLPKVGFSTAYSFGKGYLQLGVTANLSGDPARMAFLPKRAQVVY